MTVDTCRPITNVYNCPPWQDLSTFLAVPCQVNQWLLCKTRPKEKVRSCKILVAEVVRESNLKGGMSSHWGQTRVLICQVGGTGKVPPPPIVPDLLYAPQFFTFCCQMWSDKRRGWAQEGKKMFGAVNCKLSQIWVEKFPPLNRNYIMLTFVWRDKKTARVQSFGPHPSPRMVKASWKSFLPYKKCFESKTILWPHLIFIPGHIL